MESKFVMPTQLADIQQTSAWARVDTLQLVESEAKRLKTAIEAVMDTCTSYDIARQTATTNVELSPAGMQAAIRRAGEAGAERVKSICDKLLAELQTRAGKLSSALTNMVQGDADQTALSLMQERRSLLAGMDKLDVESIYTQACFDGSDELTCRAIESAPGFMKLVRLDVLEKGKVVRAAYLNPDMDTELKQVREQYEILALSRNSALRQMAQMQDTLAEQARGQITPFLDGDDDGNDE